MTGPVGPGGVVLTPLPCDVEVAAGDDLVALVIAAATATGCALRDGDVLAVASKVVAKAEGATVPLPPDLEPDAARRRLARERARRVVAESPWVLVVETHHGLVCANAGIDTSNVASPGEALLLPDDPDASAARLRDGLRRRLGVDVGVLVTDTFGRPWRLGQTDVAVGAAGVEVLRDDRGSRDRHGRRLGVSMAAVGDALAAAADLVRRKHDGTPFVLVRGAAVAGDGDASDLRRPSEEDLFRTGGSTAAGAALAAAAGARRGAPAVAPTSPGDDLVTALRAAVAALTDGDCTPDVEQDGTIVIAGSDLDLGAARTAVLVLAAGHGLEAHVATAAGTLRITLGGPRAG